MCDIFDFTGKVAMVVGVGGIGRAQALGFARYGADVVTADSRLEVAEAVAEEVRALARKALAVKVDVADEKSVTDMVNKAIDTFARIDILVNTAGINIRGYTPTDFPIEEWQKVINVNARGTLLCCQAVGRVMIKQGDGRIINMSSVRGSYAAPQGGLGYCDSKAAVNLITKVFACAWAKHNILVNALAPTVVETEFTRPVLESPEGARQLREGIPMGRWAVPEDIVGPTLFFASPASGFVTGQILCVDGGLTSRI